MSSMDILGVPDWSDFVSTVQQVVAAADERRGEWSGRKRRKWARQKILQWLETNREVLVDRIADRGDELIAFPPTDMGRLLEQFDHLAIRILVNAMITASVTLLARNMLADVDLED